MPELPEVQTVVNDLIQAQYEGKVIKDIEVLWERTIEGFSKEEFLGKIKGKKVLKIFRRAKYIIFELEKDFYMSVHLRMTGQFHQDKEENPHVRVVLRFEDGASLYYLDTRKFGRFNLIFDYQEFDKGLGIEPFLKRFNKIWLYSKSKKSTRAIKSFLLDQKIVCGLGNIYVDESLFLSRIHPLRKANTLSIEECERLVFSIRAALENGLKNMGSSLGNSKANFYSVSGRKGRNQDQFKVFRRHGQKCFDCGTQIERIVVSQRGTHFCPNCQKGNA